MNQEIINKIINEYKRKKQLEIERVEELKLFALKNENYKKLDIEENNLIIEIGRLEFLKQDVQNQFKRLEQISKEKEKILLSMKINPKDILIKTNCAKCLDTGFVNGNICDCIKKEYAKKILLLSNVNLKNFPLLKNYNFDIFIQNNKEKMQKIVNILQKYIDSYNLRTIFNINFLGESGTGKTYLSLCLANELQNMNLIINNTSAFNLNITFLKAHTSPIEQKYNILETYLNSDILIIDDLGTEPFYKNVTAEYLFLIINERQSNNLTTIITSNLTPTQILDRYGERVFSRIFNKQKALTFNFNNEDLRLK